MLNNFMGEKKMEAPEIRLSGLDEKSIVQPPFVNIEVNKVVIEQPVLAQLSKREIVESIDGNNSDILPVEIDFSKQEPRKRRSIQLNSQTMIDDCSPLAEAATPEKLGPYINEFDPEEVKQFEIMN